MVQIYAMKGERAIRGVWMCERLSNPTRWGAAKIGGPARKEFGGGGHKEFELRPAAVTMPPSDPLSVGNLEKE